MNDMGGAFTKIYIKPWTRIGPYVIGIVTGYLLHDARQTDKRLGRVTVWVWWIASTAVALALVYGLSDYYADGTTPSKAADVIYLTFSR